MVLIQFLIVVVLVAIGLYLANRYLPMEPRIRDFLNIITIIILILWFLDIIGVLALVGLHVPR